MLELRGIADQTLKTMKTLGMDKSQVVTRETTTYELDLQSAGIQLFRTTFDHALGLRGIQGGRQAKTGGNNLSKEGIARTLKGLVEGIEASPQDDAYDIADIKIAKEFNEVPKSVDLEKMLLRVTDYLKWSQEKFPKMLYESSQFRYVETREVFLNSNGVQLTSKSGNFRTNLFFSAKDGKKTSSFDGSSVIENELGGPLQACGGIEELLAQSTKHLDPQNIAGKFTGDVIMTPFFLPELMGEVLEQLGTTTLMTGQSLFQKSLDKKIFSDQISLISDPLSADFAARDHYTGDGFLTEKMPIIQNGVLKTYLLGQYGSKKLGLSRAKTDGSHLRILPGTTPRAKLIENMKQGILITRLSAGRPASNGDFSGVAKNSFYIENGKIMYPVKEVMVSGNYATMLNQVKGVSQETVNFGTSEFPWIHCGGATIA